MSAPTPYDEPARIVAGDTAKWLKSLPNYPASAGWVLSYTLVNSAERYTATAAASGDDHLTTIAAGTTVGWKAGDYALRGKVALAGEGYTVAEARITVSASFGTVVDTRSQARQALDAIDAYMADPTHLAASQYQIAGRELTRHNLSTIIAYRSKLAIIVANEEAAIRAAAGLAPKGRILVRFGA